MRRHLDRDLELRHQAHVEAHEVEPRDPGLGETVAHALSELGQGQKIVLALGGSRHELIVGHPRPAVAVVPHDEAGVLRRVGLQRPAEDRRQLLGITGVDLAAVLQQLGGDHVLLLVALDPVEPCTLPVAVPVDIALGAVDQRQHLDIAGLGQARFDLVDVAQAERLEIVVGGDVDHDRPVARWRVLGSHRLRNGEQRPCHETRPDHTAAIARACPPEARSGAGVTHPVDVVERQTDETAVFACVASIAT